MARKTTMKKKPKSAVLEPTERTTIVALSSQRQQIIASAEAQIAELDEAMKTLQESYVQKYGLMDAAEYRFRQESRDGHLILELECVEDEPPEAEPSEAEVADGDD